ncbi:maleylpyruvate isomerase family mycothiol-dependent enzyme [Amycolatopsis suaedae]|uniref:Maleylpyruvate isomerase family mycothiol-dependent enzyme n=1 Tax=Amycolatopsis suaedae TaxID=2510978 RepID=A0A4Q7J142_9PSEU|nr:maleylpyruvate isomerase family mycothiol-dependent enzyme [Amycolatopsis suaedae]RZQ59654.1 maleylpyruvate isomerase family mycothiol-dependent enzyme [Amycolatopsis suaedae]
MTGGDVMTFATQERGDFADFLDTLTPRQWEAQSLCAGWTVRQVVAHVISYDELTLPNVVRRIVRGRFTLGRINDIGMREYDRDPGELITLLRAHQRPRGLTAGFGGMIGLLDATIHQQDIRRPLGLPREIPADRLRTALRLVLRAPPVRAYPRARGLTLVAEDVDWRWGSGPEVRGPGEAVLMAVAGRGHALDELSGPGKDVLARRL